MFYPRAYRELCERFGYWPWILMVAVFVSVVLYRGYQKSEIEVTEKQLAIEACAATGALPDCEELIESHHEACFEYNYYGAAFRGTSRLDRKGYRECLDVGFDTYIAELRARERENLALQNKLLN